jgi:hypothetical protein
VPGQAGRAHDHLEPSFEGRPRVLVDEVRVPRGRHDPHLVRHVELLEDQAGLTQDRELGGRCRQDADEWGGLDLAHA